VRVFDRDKGKGWGEEFRDVYEGESYGASFAQDGRLATTSQDPAGTIRLYDSKFRLVAKVEAPSGAAPSAIAFSPDAMLLAVGYAEIPAVDVLDGKSLARAPGPSPSTKAPWPNGLEEVAWSHDGGTLFAASTADMEQNVLLAWDQAGKGEERRQPLCSSGPAAGLWALPDGRVLAASMGPCLGLTGLDGNTVWTAASNVPNFRQQSDSLRVSQDGTVVDFSFGDAADTRLRFDVRSLRLSIGATDDGLTFAPFAKVFRSAVGEMAWSRHWAATPFRSSDTIPREVSRLRRTASDFFSVPVSPFLLSTTPENSSGAETRAATSGLSTPAVTDE
jgi:hypothetical protein